MPKTVKFAKSVKTSDGGPKLLSYRKQPIQRYVDFHVPSVTLSPPESDLDKKIQSLQNTCLSTVRRALVFTLLAQGRHSVELRDELPVQFSGIVRIIVNMKDNDARCKLIAIHELEKLNLIAGRMATDTRLCYKKLRKEKRRQNAIQRRQQEIRDKLLSFVVPSPPSSSS
ncbi:unnamed protein product [Sympodiomycopsis kandeliae]